MSNGDANTERGSEAGQGEAGEERKRRRRRRSATRTRTGRRSDKAAASEASESRRSEVGESRRSEAGESRRSEAGESRRSERRDSIARRRKRRRRRGEGAEGEGRSEESRERRDAEPGERDAGEARRSRTRRSAQARQVAGDDGDAGRRSRRRKRKRRSDERGGGEVLRDEAGEANVLSDAGEAGDAPMDLETKEFELAGIFDDELDRVSLDEDADGELSEPGLARFFRDEDALVGEPDDDDPDPVTFGLEQLEVDERVPLDAGVQSVAGVKFSAAGRIYLYDCGEEQYARDEEVVVESERGLRLGTVAVATHRRSGPRVAFKRVLRRPNRTDRRSLERNEERSTRALQTARQVARSLALPIKIFRTEYAHTGKKVRVYFTSEERIDFRELVRRLTTELKGRVEMRQTGVRDEAKMVGGIGSCGQELCCTTWLPDFVPVSIKMAKDQGLVLNPTKVSGQCGRLKCCLVYEQDTYAELRKGLPKLGKRVVTEAGEGKVVEVDVLHQRVRVSLGSGEFQVFAGSEVKPLFPTQAQPSKKPRR